MKASKGQVESIFNDRRSIPNPTYEPPKEQDTLFDMNAGQAGVRNPHTVEHSLHHGSEMWTGATHDPDFVHPDTPRPGMTHGPIPGQMVMGAQDLSHEGSRGDLVHGSRYEMEGYAQGHVVNRQYGPGLTEHAPTGQDMEVRAHGGTYTPNIPESVTPFKAGPQMNSKAVPVWEQYGERRQVRSDTPIHTGQPNLRYNPSADLTTTELGGKDLTVRNPVQIKGKITEAGATDNGDPTVKKFFGGGTDNGLPKIIKKDETLYQIDGNHRMFEGRNRGQEHNDVDFMDFDKHPEAEAALYSNPTKHKAQTDAQPAAPVGNMTTGEMEDHMNQEHPEAGIGLGEHTWAHENYNQPHYHLDTVPGVKVGNANVQLVGSMPSDPGVQHHNLNTAQLQKHIAKGHQFDFFTDEVAGRNTLNGIHDVEHAADAEMGREEHQHNLFKSYPGTTEHGRVNRYGQQLHTYHEVRKPKRVNPEMLKGRESAAKNDDSFML